jgi:EpsI family protein
MVPIRAEPCKYTSQSYEAQGFKIVYSAKGQSDVGFEPVPVMRLIATQDRRVEPITYWIRTGNYVVRGWLEQNIARVKNGLLTGYTPDGLLVRVSSIDEDKERAYKLQDDFLRALVAASRIDARTMLLGSVFAHTHPAP